MTFQVVCSYADTHEGVDQDCEGAVQQHIYAEAHVKEHSTGRAVHVNRQ
jgi:hypothetical protein